MKGGEVHPVKIIRQNDRHIVVKNEDRRRAKVPLEIIERVFTCKIARDMVDDTLASRAILTEYTKIGISESGAPVYGRLIYADSLYYIVIRICECLGCVNKNESDLQLILESGTHIAFRHIGENQCNDCANEIITLLLYGNLGDIKEEDIQPMQAKILDMLKKEKISHLRLYGTESHADVELTEQGKYFIRDGIICIMRALEN
jgi:hypothetical protein